MNTQVLEQTRSKAPQEEEGYRNGLWIHPQLRSKALLLAFLALAYLLLMLVGLHFSPPDGVMTRVSPLVQTRIA